MPWRPGVVAVYCLAQMLTTKRQLAALLRKGEGLSLEFKRSTGELKEGMQTLSRQGNPYAASLFDADGRVGIDWGVYGVPETFIIDQQGIFHNDLHEYTHKLKMIRRIL